MDLKEFVQYVDEAPSFVANYEEKELILLAQLDEKNRTKITVEIRLLEEWIGSNSKWLTDNREKYTKCLTIISLGTKHIQEIKTIYEEIYGHVSG